MLTIGYVRTRRGEVSGYGVLRVRVRDLVRALVERVGVRAGVLRRPEDKRVPRRTCNPLSGVRTAARTRGSQANQGRRVRSQSAPRTGGRLTVCAPFTQVTLGLGVSRSQMVRSWMGVDASTLVRSRAALEERRGSLAQAHRRPRQGVPTEQDLGRECEGGLAHGAAEERGRRRRRSGLESQSAPIRKLFRSSVNAAPWRVHAKGAESSER